MIERLVKGREIAKKQLEEIKENTLKKLEKDKTDIFEGHITLLEDEELFSEIDSKISQKKCTAEESGPAVRVGDHLHIVQLVGVHGARPQGPHLPAAHEGVEGLHGLLDGGVVVEAVDDVQVEVVGAQALQRAVDLALDGRARQVPPR